MRMRGAAIPCTPARGSGERCELPSRVSGEATTAQRFLNALYSALRVAFPDTIILLVVNDSDSDFYLRAVGRKVL